ncbi:MAG: C25 family cysteine peptidase, partial [Bacteroidia bacterium]
MKPFLLVFTTFFGLLSVFGQQSSFSGYSTNTNNSESIVEFQLGEYSLQPIVSNGIEYSIPQSAKAARLLQKGAPDLIQFSSSVQIPDAGNIRLEVLDVQYEEIPNVRIAPSYGNIMRSENPAQIARIEGLQYSQNAFFPAEPATAGTPYIFRNTRGIAIHVYPMQYNPVTNILRVNHSIRVRVISESGALGINERNPQRASKATFGDKELYQRHFLNSTPSRYDAPESQGKMLVISHDAFSAAMEPFVAWKKQCGIPTELVNFSDLGGTTEITNRIRDEYYANNLRYVVLVGDIDQIPSPVRSGGKSDPSYGYVDGDDAYPEVQIGRFSAETIADVQTQVQRVINYEQATSGNHFSRVIGIGSQEGPGDDGEMDFEHIRNMHADLLDYSYTNAAEFFEGSQGGNDASGDPSAEELAAEINAGAGLILYTGHG